ncbi:MAG: DUF2244 domain-containing protein [Rhodomicrobium sp.]
MQNLAPGHLAAAAHNPASFHQFTATLLPGHALPREGFVALLFNIAAISYLSVIVFVAVGASPLALLWCLDAAVCYGVYQWKYAPSRLSEKVELTEEILRVTRTNPSGKAESWDFNPYWVRLEHKKRQGAADELWLSSHGRKLAVGAFLSDGEKANFANALSTALAFQRSSAPMQSGEI